MNLQQLSEKYPDNHTTIVYYTPPYHQEPIELYCLVPTLDQYNSIGKDYNYFELINSCVKNENIEQILDEYPAASLQISKPLLEACRLLYAEEQKAIGNKLNSYKTNVAEISTGFEALLDNKMNIDRKAFVIYCSRLMFYIDGFFTSGDKK